MDDVLGNSSPTDARQVAPVPAGTTAVAETGVDLDRARQRMRRFLAEQQPSSPCLVIDLATVRARYRELTAALPGARMYYAVKANPAPEVVRELVRQGAFFDAASPAEIELCLREGASPDSISYGNTIKKHADIAYAYAVGIRLFTSDSVADLEALACNAPGSAVFCRIRVVNSGVMPFGRKFGCEPDSAVELIGLAARLGLRPVGVSFHVGSQQLDPGVWEQAIAVAAQVTAKVAANSITLPLLNIGGGLPGHYLVDTPTIEQYADSIFGALKHHFRPIGPEMPGLVMEPGRFLVADAGLLSSEVVLVSRKSIVGDDADLRWVYLDVGRYGGLAETDYIEYRLATPGYGADAETGPVVLAGPTCDGDDVLYQRTLYRLPSALRAGDNIEILNTGAYTASYSSIEFNGFGPLPTHCI